jgi:hypothetical protein
MEVSRRMAEVHAARMGMDLARAEVDLRRMKAAKGIEKSRIKAGESRVFLLRSLAKEDYPAIRDLQARLLKAQTEEPAAAAAIQSELLDRQRSISVKHTELELHTIRATGGDPARIQALERRLEDLRRQIQSAPGAGTGSDAKSRKGKR